MIAIFEPKRGLFLLLGAVFALIGVIAGAAASHALPFMYPMHLAWIETGQRYLLWHSLALVALDCLPAQHNREIWRGLAGYCFLTGILLFAGSLWLMGWLNMLEWRSVTPFGGMAFVFGWAALIPHAVTCLRQKDRK